MRRALEENEADVGSHAECRAAEANDGGSFVDIMGNRERDTGGESEGLTFADILQRAYLLSETLLDGVVDAPRMTWC